MRALCQTRVKRTAPDSSCRAVIGATSRAEKPHQPGTSRTLRHVRKLDRLTHNPKVAGSNPAPACLARQAPANNPAKRRIATIAMALLIATAWTAVAVQGPAKAIEPIAPAACHLADGTYQPACRMLQGHADGWFKTTDRSSLLLQDRAPLFVKRPKTQCVHGYEERPTLDLCAGSCGCNHHHNSPFPSIGSIQPPILNSVSWSRFA